MDAAGGAEGPLDTVSALADLAARVTRSAAPVLLAAAVSLHAAHRAALQVPEAFARGGGPSRGEDSDLVERSIRAELAVAVGLSERALSRRLEQAQLLVDELPRTRAALAAARILWEAGEVICAAAATLPRECRSVFDERAAEAALEMTPTELRRRVARLRDDLHVQPLAERHARAREDRSVWVSPEIDGMARLCAVLPAPAAIGAYNRLDRIARALRDRASGDDAGVGPSPRTSPGDARTLAQLRADALTDLLCDGDIPGTTPVGGSDGADRTFVPGVHADVRLTVPARTAVGLDDVPAHLDGYGLIPADVARRLTTVGAALTRVLTDPDTGAVTSVGRTHRLPPPRLRLHLQLRDQTCRFPGCTRPASTAEADHAVEWRNGGESALDNLASLCAGHHHVRHGDRWTYVLHPDGVADWTTPTGRRVTTRPPDLPGRPPDPRPRPRSADPPHPL